MEFRFINTGSNNNSIKSISTTICVCYMLSLCYISMYLQVSAVKSSLSGVDQPPAILSATAKQNGLNQEVPQMSDPAG